MIRLSERSKRYLLIGVSVYIFELAIILAAQSLGTTAVVAVGLSFWLGLILSFGLQKFIAFEDKRTSRAVMSWQVAAFGALVIFNFVFTIILTKLIGHHLPAAASRTIALGITTLWNFYLYKTRIFHQADMPIY